MPYILNVVIVLQHFQKLFHELDILGILQLNIVLRNHGDFKMCIRDSRYDADYSDITKTRNPQKRAGVTPGTYLERITG